VKAIFSSSLLLFLLQGCSAVWSKIERKKMAVKRYIYGQAMKSVLQPGPLTKALMPKIMASQKDEAKIQQQLIKMRPAQDNGNQSFAWPKDKVSIVEQKVPGSERNGNYNVPVRIVRPLNAEKKYLPIIVHFHGGGFMIVSFYLGCY
jgi:acetyl esterase/lipase